MRRRLLGRWRVSRPLRRAGHRRLVACVLAGVLGLWVGAQVRTAEQVRSRWGPTVRVLVATTDLAPGAVPGADEVTGVDWPLALVPPGALRSLATDAAPLRLHDQVARGQVLTEHDVADAGGGPWAAQLEPGRVALRVPLGSTLSGVAAGDRVDVLAATGTPPWGDAFGEPGSGGATVLGDAGAGAGGAQRVAQAALVLEVDPDGVVLSLRGSQAEPTAAAAMAGPVTVVVLP